MKNKGIHFVFLFAAIFMSDKKIFAQNFGYTFVDWDDISLLENNTVKCDTAILIITNRKYDPINNNKKYFGDEIDSHGKLTYLIACCDNNKWTIFVKETFEDAMRSININNDFLFFVHGDGQTFPNLLDRCIRIDRLYNVNIIAFDWPSKKSDFSKIRNYFNSKKNAKRSVSDFGKSLKHIQDFRAENRSTNDSIHYTLFFHSLGNYILEKFIKSPLNSSVTENLFDNILLNAPAVKQKRHRRWVEKMNFQKRIYITSNKKDFTLNGARLITFRRQLGERLKKPLARNANYINFRNLVYQKHNYFLDLQPASIYPSLSFFYRTLFHGRCLDLEEKSKFRKRKDGLGYDIL